MTLVNLAIGDLFLELDNGVQQCVWPWRTTGDIDVHGQEVVDAGHGAIGALIGPTGSGAHAHRDHVFRVGHLVVYAAHGVRHFDRDSARDDHDVSLAGRGAIDLHPEA